MKVGQIHTNMLGFHLSVACTHSGLVCISLTISGLSTNLNIYLIHVIVGFSVDSWSPFAYEVLGQKSKPVSWGSSNAQSLMRRIHVGIAAHGAHGLKYTGTFGRSCDSQVALAFRRKPFYGPSGCVELHLEMSPDYVWHCHSQLTAVWISGLHLH